MTRPASDWRRRSMTKCSIITRWNGAWRRPRDKNKRPRRDRFKLRAGLHPLVPIRRPVRANESSHAATSVRHRRRTQTSLDPRSHSTVPILPTIQDPADLRGLDEIHLAQLAVEIRDTIVRTVASTGGHLGSSLGVVELTIALHRLLESPRDRIVWDTGHQAYPHKLLTGRFERFGTLRQLDGIGGVPPPPPAPPAA